jgi:hypothetical protein
MTASASSALLWPARTRPPIVMPHAIAQDVSAETPAHHHRTIPLEVRAEVSSRRGPALQRAVLPIVIKDRPRVVAG